MKFTDLNRDTQFNILPFVVFLGFFAYFGYLKAADASIFDTVWTKVRPAAKQPYIYTIVLRVDQTCRHVLPKNRAPVDPRTNAFGQPISGSDPHPNRWGQPINGCNVIHPGNICEIYLPERAHQDTVEHEEKHCQGYAHD